MTAQLLRLSDFTPHLSSQFSLYYDENAEPLDMELIEVNELKSDRQEDLGKAFSLVFRSQPNLVLPQSIYRLEHEIMATIEIFLVPIGPDAQGMCYEAVFT